MLRTLLRTSRFDLAQSEETINHDNQWLDTVWKHTSLPRQEFNATYVPLFDAVLPMLAAAEKSRDKPTPNLVRNTKKLILSVLKKRQAFIIPKSAPSEDSARMTEVMSFALIICVTFDEAMPIWLNSDYRTKKALVCPLVDPTELGELHGRAKSMDRATSLLFVSALLPAPALRWLWQEPAAINEIVRYFTARGQSEFDPIVSAAVPNRPATTPATPTQKPSTSEPAPKQAIESTEPSTPPTQNLPNQSRPAAQPTAPRPKRPAGMEYLRWLRTELNKKRLSVNKPESPIHVLRDGTVLLIRPDAFEDYARKQGIEVKRLENQLGRVQKHRVRPDGTNLFSAKDSSGHAVSGYVLKDLAELYPQGSPGQSTVISQVT